MAYDILIFKGTPGDFVSLQQYEGKAAFPKTLQLDDEPYQLSVFEHNGKKYLIAHDQPLVRDVTGEAIDQFCPQPV